MIRCKLQIKPFIQTGPMQKTQLKNLSDVTLINNKSLFDWIIRAYLLT